MITTRQSGASGRNPDVTEQQQWTGSNTEWVASLGADVAQPGAVLLLGGSSVVDFRLRVAQSHLRQDLMPSFWSTVGILISRDEFLSVPIGGTLRVTDVPPANAIHRCALGDYADGNAFPNIAVVAFSSSGASIVDNGRRLMTQRAAVDLPLLLHGWLGFVWGIGSSGNPLMQGIGVPSAAFVETAFGIAGIELTPGVASQSSCPEAIWQSAIWWHEYYEKTSNAFAVSSQTESQEAVAAVPRGAFLTRQRAAAVSDPEDTARKIS